MESENLPSTMEKKAQQEETESTFNGLRQRNITKTLEISPEKKGEQEELYELTGITFDGKTFKVPKTKNPLKIYPIREWDLFDWLKNGAAFNIIWFFLPIPKWFFIVLFIFWRLAYNLGIGLLLYKQSNEKWMTKTYEKLVANDVYRKWFKKFLPYGMGNDYNFETIPNEFNAWLAWRHFVDIVLAQDLACYIGFCLRYWEFPETISLQLIFCYIVGTLLCAFTFWAKTDAYRVVKDFAWYWGDFFFLIKQNLTFDRVFSISPHPMYTIGYSFFYGAALITQSYTVLYVSLFGHFCQLAFLSLVENPHIEKTYPGMVEDRENERNRILYDAQTGYFRRDLIVFKNLDIFRSSDLFMLLIIGYTLFLNLLNLPSYFYIIHLILWRIIHNIVLGYILHLQSTQNFWTNHFINLGYNKQTAFEHWKRIYNLSLVMNHIVFFCCALKLSEVNFDNYGQAMVKQTLGLVLIALNAWSSVSTFEALGEFGWFYGDFFIDEVPSFLYYHGIYRFLNNPDSVTGFAAYYGLALMSDSATVFGLAMFAQGLHLLFVKYVENPHMKKLYGNKVRGKSGFHQAMDEIAQEAIQKSPGLQKLSKAAEEVKIKAEKMKTKVTETIQNDERFPC